MNKAGYSLVAWGIGLTLFHIRIGIVDTAIIGSLLTLAGASRLGATEGKYRIAAAGAVLQAILACVAITGLRMDLSLLGNEGTTMLELLRVAGGIVIGMATMLGLCAGLQADAEALGRHALARSARSAWRGLLAIDGVGLFLLPFLLNVVAADMIYAVLMIGGAAFIVQARILLLFRQARRWARGGPGTQGTIPRIE